MRVLLFGLTGFGNTVLRALKELNCDICGLITRKEDGIFPYYKEQLLSDEARLFGIPVFESPDLNKLGFFEKIKSMMPELMLVATFHEKIPVRILKLASLGAINFHPSLLPGYRGDTPTTWTLICGEQKTGVTAHYINGSIDSGDIIIQRTLPVAIEDTDGSLRKKLAVVAGEITREIIITINNGSHMISVPQDKTRITYFPKRTTREGMICFNEPTINIHNRIRSTIPYPGAYFVFRGSKNKILHSSPHYEPVNNDLPGYVVETFDDSILVKTKDGLIRLWLSRSSLSLNITKGVLLEENVKASGNEEFYKPVIVHTRDAYGLEKDAEDFPKMVVLSVIYSCNAHCPNCPYTKGNSELRSHYLDAPYMPAELFKKISDECGRFRAFIRITGGGEPMLHPNDMVSLIEYAKIRGAQVWLNTNGTNMNKENIERLLECGLDQIEFSVDAADPITYNIVRKGLNFEKLVASVRHMIELRNKLMVNTNIVASVVMQDIVKDKLQDIESFWKELGVDDIITRKFLTWGSNTSIDPSKSADDSPYLDKEGGVPCPYPFHRLNIDTRGKVEVCGYDISGRTNFGNVRTKSIQEIWKGTLFTWWRKMHMGGRGLEIPLCRECSDWQYRSWNYNWERVLTTASLNHASLGQEV